MFQKDRKNRETTNRVKISEGTTKKVDETGCHILSEPEPEDVLVVELLECDPELDFEIELGDEDESNSELDFEL